MPFGIQPIHIVIIIVVAFLLFGATKLPEIGRSLGKSISEFRKGTKEAAEGFKEEVNKPDSAEAQSAPTVSPATAQPVITPGNFCIQCGTANPPEARFCASCGAKLAEKTA
ncbi:MAG: twin-arginine translocase TatA/TatE family subunit [Anaerolineales bacterium]